MGTALVFVSAPEYWLGLIALYLFAADIGQVKIFPGAGSYVGLTSDPWKWFTSLLLPWLVLAAGSAAIYARLMRGSLTETMQEDFIRTARAKGLSERRVVVHHGVRAAINPILTILALDIATLLGGAILVEVVFNIPGIGQLAYTAIRHSDLLIVQGTVLLGAIFVIVANIVVDIVYAYLDPRVTLPVSAPGEPLLRVEDLRVEFPTEDGVVKAVDGITYEVGRGRTLGVVGESGSGKTVTAMTILGLTRAQGARITGRIVFEGRDLLSLEEGELRKVRGNEIAMIFQDPSTALHPLYRVGAQIVEAVRAHRDVTKAQARKRTIELLGLVGIPDPGNRVDDYPHEFSGGMRQRAMIAMALANEPKLLIADEPTTALDVTVQAQILALLRAAARRARDGDRDRHARHRRGRGDGRRDRRDVRRADRRDGRDRDAAEQPRAPLHVGPACARSRNWTARAWSAWSRSRAARRA